MKVGLAVTCLKAGARLSLTHDESSTSLTFLLPYYHHLSLYLRLHSYPEFGKSQRVCEVGCSLLTVYSRPETDLNYVLEPKFGLRMAKRKGKPSAKRSQPVDGISQNSAAAGRDEIRESDHPPVHSLLLYPTFRLMHGKLEMFVAIHSKNPSSTLNSLIMTIADIEKSRGKGLQIDNGDGKILELFGASEVDIDEEGGQESSGQVTSTEPNGMLQVIQAMMDHPSNSFEACKIQMFNPSDLFVWFSPSTRADSANAGTKGGYSKVSFTDHLGVKIPGLFAKSLAKDYMHRAFQRLNFDQEKGLNASLIEVFDNAITKYLSNRPDWNDLVDAAAKKNPDSKDFTKPKYFHGPTFNDGVSPADYDRSASSEPRLLKRMRAENALRNKTLVKKPATAETPTTRTNSAETDLIEEIAQPLHKHRRFTQQDVRNEDDRSGELTIAPLATLHTFWWKFTDGHFETARQLVEYLRQFTIRKEGKEDEMFRLYFAKVAQALNSTFGLEPNTISIESVFELQWEASQMSAKVDVHLLPYCKYNLTKYQIDWDAKIQLPMSVKLAKMTDDSSDISE